MSFSVIGAPSAHESAPAASGNVRFASTVACAKRGVPRRARAARFASSSAASALEPGAGGGGRSARLSGVSSFVR